jgi:hypothetical protein
MVREAVPRRPLPNHEASSQPAEQNRRRLTTNSAQSICTCRNRSPVRTSVNYKYWNFRLAIDQERFPDHEKGCPLYKINNKTTSRTQIDIPLKMASFSRCTILACVELVLGTGKPGVSVNLKNLVPAEKDPFYRILEDFDRNMLLLQWYPGVLGKHITVESTFGEFKQEIVSLYRSRKSSPYYRNERGQSHATIFFNAAFIWRLRTGLLMPDFFNMSMKLFHMLVEMSDETGGDLQRYQARLPRSQACQTIRISPDLYLASFF